MQYKIALNLTYFSFHLSYLKTFLTVFEANIVKWLAYKELDKSSKEKDIKNKKEKKDKNNNILFLDSDKNSKKFGLAMHTI